jgi:hypothetical protein
LIQIRIPSKDELIYHSLGNGLYQDLAYDNLPIWSPYFSIDEVDDFQVSIKDENEYQSHEKPKLKKKEWYIPTEENGYLRFIRIILSTENEATIQLLITNPLYPEYQIVNRTLDDIKFGQV